MKIAIIVHHPFPLWCAPPWFAERLRRDFPVIEVIQRDNYRTVDEDLRDTEIAISWSLRGEQVIKANKLRWIHSTAAAVHQLMSPELVQSDIVVTNARSVHGPVVAEHAIALVLAMAKRLPSAMRWQARKTWAQDAIWQERPRPHDVVGSTLGLLGLGAIGGEVARLGAALGMRIIGVREHPERGLGFPAADSSHIVLGPNELDRMLSAAEYVVIAAPVTSQTKAVLDRQRLEKMKPDAYLVNVSRGVLIAEAALVEALRARKIGGAALDVFEHEPLPADSPLWELDNVLITPHTAGLTDKMWERHYVLFTENLRRFMAGQELIGLVDKSKGY